MSTSQRPEHQPLMYLCYPTQNPGLPLVGGPPLVPLVIQQPQPLVPRPSVSLADILFHYMYGSRQSQKSRQCDRRFFKTVLCKSYEEGKKCNYGDRCQFAHGEMELRQRPSKTQQQTAPRNMDLTALNHHQQQQQQPSVSGHEKGQMEAVSGDEDGTEEWSVSVPKLLISAEKTSLESSSSEECAARPVSLSLKPTVWTPFFAREHTDTAQFLSSSASWAASSNGLDNEGWVGESSSSSCGTVSSDGTLSPIEDGWNAFKSIAGDFSLLKAAISK